MALLRALVAAGARASDKDRKDETPLHVACRARRESLEMVQYLCEEALCDVDALNTDGWSPVLLAVAVGYVNVLEYLLSRGASLHQRTALAGWTLLHAAAANGQATMCEVLVRKGLSPSAASAKGELPRTVAPERSPCARRLLELGAEEAIRTGDAAQLSHYLARGVSLSALGAWGVSLAESVAQSGDASLLALIAQRRRDRLDSFRAGIIVAFLAALYLGRR